MDKQKGHKIIGALYLVTNHLTDSDPLKVILREEAVALVAGEQSDCEKSARIIEDLLNAAVLARLISEKNASIITLEVRRFAEHMGGEYGDTVNALFEDQVSTDIKKTFQSQMSFKAIPTNSKTSPSVVKNNDKKSTRQASIMSFINNHKSATIKDIAALFPGVSEKTIQRELGLLVASGRITKRGQKRWSVYMAVGA